MKYKHLKFMGMIPWALPIVWIAPIFGITGRPQHILLGIGIIALLIQMTALIIMVVKTRRGEFL